ncbi:MAG: exodeoxyribonuclease VII large subunit [Deltaproteobacteria bacterium]|nr:exodeoxyribonuclease VII large subunit [Deltaproteobacteria bacterium]
MQIDSRNRTTQDTTYTVSQLNRKVRALLEKEYKGVWIEAEVSDVTRARSGHVYFTLVDPGGKAQMSAVMWKGVAMRYGSRLEAGTAVRCHGRVTLYEVRGSYQFIADRVEEAGAGAKARLLAELKAKLEAEGLFAPEHKRPLPPFPDCVGVVTSRSGAALRDIIKVATRRFPARILLVHAQVQGASAPQEIVRALDLLAGRDDVDVVIVGRGGGSSEDLDAFNAEEVVRAVRRHPRPVVSAVGHEIDVALVDLAADRRAATPSEAAEMTVPDAEALKEGLAATRDLFEKTIRHRLGVDREKLALKNARLRSRDPRVHLRRGIEALTRARGILERWPDLTLTRARADLAMAEEPLHRWPEAALMQKKSELGRLVANLEPLSPLASLSRGYAVVRKTDDQDIVRSAEEAPPGTEVDVTLAKGRLICDVKESLKDWKNF